MWRLSLYILYMLLNVYNVYTNTDRDIIVPNNSSRMCRRGFDLLFSGRTRLLYTHSVCWLPPTIVQTGRRLTLVARALQTNGSPESRYVVARSSSTVVLRCIIPQDDFISRYTTVFFWLINIQNIVKCMLRNSVIIL